VLNRDEDATVSAEGNPGHEELAAVPDEVDASDGLSELGGEGPSDDGDGHGVLVPNFEADGSMMLGLVGTFEGRNELCAEEPDKTDPEGSDSDGHGVLDSETNVLVPDFEADGSMMLGLVGTFEGRNELCAEEPDKTDPEGGDSNGHGVLDSETKVPEIVETDELDNVQAVVVLDSPGGQVEVSVERVLDVRTYNKMEKRT
jgi:hypothetical protein